MFQICNTLQYIHYSIVDKDVKKQFEANSKQVNILQTASLMYSLWFLSRVSVQGVKSLGGHFACLCRGFEFYEVKKKILSLFFKKKMEILLHFLSFL